MARCHRDQFDGPQGYVPNLDKPSFLVDLPAGKGRRWLNRGCPVNTLIGAWTVSGIFNLYQSGSPLTISWSADSADVGVYGVRPNRTCSGRLSDPTMQQFFDTSCFVAQTPGTFGNSGTGILFGPSQSFLGDLAVHKNFVIRENIAMRFRTEIFNTFNHPVWLNPGTTAGQARFGQVLGKSPTPRVIQLALRLTFWFDE